MNKSGPPRNELLLVNGRAIPVALVRSRRARRYVLRLRADGLASLTIPRSGSAKEALEFARRQGRWLERQLQSFPSRPVQPTQWRLGTEILFRGELTKIEALSSSWSGDTHQSAPADSQSAIPDLQSAASQGGESPSAKVIQLGDLRFTVPDITCDLRPAIERDLRALAERQLPARTFEFVALHQLSVRRVIVRAQRSRWGSCSFSGVISLNWRLIQTPPFVSDYIILHELMHLRQMNHSARFWKEVERVCPDYQSAKLWLKRNPGLLDTE
ncbi:MAG: M48 family metallopeptidase [Limisphaerales bacterium]